MSFKIRGLKAAELGAFKSQCEAWVEAFGAGDRNGCEQIRQALAASPSGGERDAALAYIAKKSRFVPPPPPPPETPAKKTPIDTMRLAVNLLVLNRRPFAEALSEAAQAGKLTEAMLLETRAACDAALETARAVKSGSATQSSIWG